MNWRGEEVKTYGDVMRKGIMRCETREEAQEFTRLYRAESPHADSNVGYLAGYCSAAEAKRIWDWFGCSHPVFGTHYPEPEEAFAAGAKMGEEARAKLEARDDE